MNNLEKLWAYIREQVPPGGIPGDDGRQYRDLKAFYESGELKPDKSKLGALDMVTEPLKVCGLTPEGNELCQPGISPKKLAVAAYLLAMSIIQNVDYPTLKHYAKIFERHHFGP